VAAEPPSPGDRLSWLTAEKVLELCAHDLNNMAHAALSYIDLSFDPGLDPAARERFLRLSHEIVRRSSYFAPNLLALVRARDAPLSDQASAPLGAALTEALERHRARFPEVNLQVKRSGDAFDARVKGGDFVTLSLYHLIDNGQRYPRGGQRPNVSVDATSEGDKVRITVLDDGKGFAPGQDGYAAARFSQPGRVSGAGLGLATVRTLAEATGGSLHLMNNDEPRGARVVLRLPKAA
jgi:signal transduction histidine kinase